MVTQLSLLLTRSADVNAALQFQLTLAALGCSLAALFFSLLAAFPGLKSVLAAVRDGVLWFTLFLVLGGVAFVVWQHVQNQQPGGRAAPRTASPAVSLEMPSLGGSGAGEVR
jgi:hypothetical protein